MNIRYIDCNMLQKTIVTFYFAIFKSLKKVLCSYSKQLKLFIDKSKQSFVAFCAIARIQYPYFKHSQHTPGKALLFCSSLSPFILPLITIVCTSPFFSGLRMNRCSFLGAKRYWTHIIGTLYVNTTESFHMTNSIYGTKWFWQWQSSLNCKYWLIKNKLNLDGDSKLKTLISMTVNLSLPDLQMNK